MATYDDRKDKAARPMMSVDGDMTFPLSTGGFANCMGPPSYNPGGYDNLRGTQSDGIKTDELTKLGMDTFTRGVRLDEKLVRSASEVDDLDDTSIADSLDD